MNSLSQIKLIKLRDYLKTYRHFETLTEQEKEDYIRKILEMDEAKQEEVYTWLLYEEEMAKARLLEKLKDQVDMLGSKVKLLVNKKNEGEQALKDKLEEIELQKNLTT